jgi:hypothetical protein
MINDVITSSCSEESMSQNPINLALRFILELAALFAFAYWGLTTHSGAARYLWAIGLPLAVAVAWGNLRVPNDPDKAPVPVPGLVRLALEALVFGGATWAFYAAGKPSWALVFGIVVLGHYVVSYDRVLWLLKQ